ncbi:MAG: MATE family efflux transporter [Acidobacteriaceae bacterium]|nr:MATE family efflux transporter [Acidobacteriaceae bacterium]
MSIQVQAVGQPRSGFWRSVLEAIRGTHQDFTAGSISRAIFLLATPMVLEMLMESLFAIVDMFWVTRLGADAVATIGLTESMLTIVFSFAFGVSLSTTAMVARRIGEKDRAGATTAGAQSILLGSALALVMAIPGFLFAPQLLTLMGAGPQLVASGQHYTAIAFASSVIIMLLFLNNAILRGAGDAAAAMRVLWLSNFINLVLDPCFIFGLGPFPKLGVTGAAVSTLIGRSSGVLYQFWLLARPDGRVTVRLADLRVVPRVILSLARVSATGIAQFAVGHTSWVVLVRIVSSFGAAAVAGYAIGIRVFLFVLLPSWGLSGAAATMVGQNLGAGKPERGERAVYLTGLYNMLFLGLVSIVFIAAPQVIIDRFTADSSVAPYAIDFLRIIAYGNLVYAFGMVVVQALNGAGDTVTPTLINIVGYWFIEIPLAYLLAFRWNLQVRGVFITIPIAQLVITLISLGVFVRGGWKRRRI